MPNQVVDTLNRAFAADPVAMYLLTCHQVQSNAALLADPTVVVQPTPANLPARDPVYVTTFLHVLNGILSDLGHPLVQAKWNPTPAADGRMTFLGFEEYVWPEEPNDEDDQSE